MQRRPHLLRRVGNHDDIALQNEDLERETQGDLREDDLGEGGAADPTAKGKQQPGKSSPTWQNLA